MSRNGRVILGLGVGSLKEEFDLLGAPFDDRGARGDDALRALRAALPTNEPAYDGEFYSFGGLTVDPCALQPHLPLWIGGRTKRSLRRAVTLADGWCPFYVSIETAAQWLETFDVPPGFEVVMPAEEPLDPVGEPQATADTLGRMAAGGTTTLSARFIHHSLEHYLEQIHALAELHGELISAGSWPARATSRCRRRGRRRSARRRAGRCAPRSAGPGGPTGPPAPPRPR